MRVLFDYGCNSILDKQAMSITNNREEIIKGTIIWEVPLVPQQPENAVNNILAQTSKPELSQYLHAALFSPTTGSLLKAIKKCFPKTWPGLIEKIVKKHLEKSRNTTMGHLHMRRQGLKQSKEKPPDTDLEDNIRTNVVYCTIVDPITTKEGKIYSDLCGHLPTTSSRRKKYIYLIYVYDCNAILTTSIKNRSDKGMIRYFTYLTEDLKIRGIHPGFHLMDNVASTSLNLTMTTMNINY